MIKIIHVLLLLVLVMCWKSFAKTSVEDKKKNIELEMKVFSNKNIFEKKEAMSIWLEIKNKSSKSYYLLDNDGELGIISFFSVLNSHGQKVPYSIQMQRELDPHSVVFGRRGPLKIEIPAGTSKKIKVTPNLFKSILLQKPGEYSYHPTIFLYHEGKNGLKLNVERVLPLNFSVINNVKTHNNLETKTTQKSIEINVPLQTPIFGLKIKKLKISRDVWEKEPEDSTEERAELIVDIENVSTDKFPAVQWFGRFDMALWDCKVFHNKQMMKHDLFYRLNSKKIQYNYWYDIIKPGDYRRFKLILDPNRFPKDINEGAKEIDINGVWDLILSRKIYLSKNREYNTMSNSELAKCEKKLILPKISIIIKGWSKAKVPTIMEPVGVQ